MIRKVPRSSENLIHNLIYFVHRCKYNNSQLRRISPHGCLGSSEVNLHAALTEFEEPHQRPDPRIECPGSDTGRKVSFRNIRKDLRSLVSTTGVSSAVEKPSNPPALQGVEAPTETVVTLTPTKFTFELESEPENVQDLKLIIQASAPLSNGVTRAYSKAVQIGGVLEAVTEEYGTRKTTTTSTAPLTPPPQRSS